MLLLSLVYCYFDCRAGGGGGDVAVWRGAGGGRAGGAGEGSAAPRAPGQTPDPALQPPVAAAAPLRSGSQGPLDHRHTCGAAAFVIMIAITWHAAVERGGEKE